MLMQEVNRNFNDFVEVRVWGALLHDEDIALATKIAMKNH